MPRVSNSTNELQTNNNYTTREYNYNISYIDNFDGFIPYHESTSSSDVRINYDLFDSVRLKLLESFKELQQFCWNVQFKYNKKSKVFYNKI